MRDPLVIPLVLVVAGILLASAVEFSALQAAWPVAAFALLAIAARVRNSRRLARLGSALALLFAGVFLQAWHRPGPAPQIDAGAREVVVAPGCVVEPTVFSSDRAQFTLELEPGARARISLPVDEDREPPQRLVYGQRIEIEARLRPPHNYGNPGGFDYAGYLAHRNIFWTGTMPRGAVAKVLPGRCGWRGMGAVFGLRTAILDRIERLFQGDEYSTGMMEAVLIGETSKLERVWTENFRRTGTFHALVISGVHVTVLAGVLLFLLRLLSLPEIPALAATAAVAWLYALLSGVSAPVTRAAGGFTLYLLARFCFRRTRIMNLLAAVALAYLAWDPAQIFDASFQLSFLSVAALGALAAPLLEATSGPLARGLRGISDIDRDAGLEPRGSQFRVEVRLAAETAALWTGIPLRWAQEALALFLRLVLFGFELALISAVIQVGLALPMAEYFHRVSFSGLSANLLIVPAMNALVPAGFLAILTGWRWVASLAGWLLTASARIAEWHAQLEPSWRVPDPPAWLALAFSAALIVTVPCLRHRIARWPALAALLALFALLLWQPWPARIDPGLLELTAIDVGQGDSLLVVFPTGSTMLVDGGGLLTYGRVRRTNFDIGEDVVSPYLWSRGIRRIDVAVATHAHQDHVGGLAALLANFRPRELWTGANPPPELIERAASLGVRAIERRAGPPFDFAGTRIEVLAPTQDYAAIKPGNNDSLAFRIAYRDRSFLLTGDLERPVEARLLAFGSLTHADVLKVGHHGSKTSTIQPFLDTVAPSMAVISAGYENSFGHPSAEVLDRLAARHTAILRTDLDGAATIRTDGVRLQYEVQRWRGISHSFERTGRGGFRPDE